MNGPNPNPVDPRIDAVVFDVFRTLLRFHDDEQPKHPWEVLAAVLQRAGATASAAEVRSKRADLVSAEFTRVDHVHSDIDMALVYRQLVEALIPTCADPDVLAAEAAKEFRRAATTYCEPYDGTAQFIEELSRDYLVAVASNTQRIYTARELSEAGLYDLFSAVLFSSDIERGKPDPLLLERVLHSIGVRPEHAVYIGDNPLDDYVAAMAAGCRFVLIRHEAPYGHTELGLPASVPIIRSFDQLPPLLDGLAQ
ncbi:HAD family hydrolase [Gordonia iterans]